jgi:phthalate 4,5-dioxygenase
MGPITDHNFEHLAPSDQMITRTRRRLLMAARALRENGTLPPGVDSPTFPTR